MKNRYYSTLRRFVGIRLFILRELYYEYSTLVKQFGTTHDLYENREKLKARIVMNAHSVEKGLSLKNIKLGYGKPKILALIKDLVHYYELFKDKTMVVFGLSIIDSYLEFNKSHNIVDQDIVSAYKKMEGILKENVDQYKNLNGGCFETSREKIH